jgi:uncharacterized hydrophobic protein (TIGR00271 family)
VLGGIRNVWKEGNHDLIVVGASRIGMLGGHIGAGVGAKLSKGAAKPPVVIVGTSSPITKRFVGVTENVVDRFVPQIDRENRVSLVERVQSTTHWDFDFFALMFLSTIMAAIGLIQNSAAVVIGAMLVAPLMTPLLGMGLALVQGNPVLARISLRSIVLGLLVALSVGLVVGLATPGFGEPTREMLGRGGAGMLDLIVAFAAGLAAAYASCRPGLLAALPGVAIAAALVPPIATAGLALSLGNFHLAIDALLLFVINMVTIVLATMAALWAVGLRNLKKTSRWTMNAGIAVMVAVLALGVYTSILPQLRPTETEISASLLEKIQEILGEDYRLDGVAIAYDELGMQLNVRVVGRKLAPKKLSKKIRRVARRHFSKPVRVRMLTQIKLGTAPP